MLYDRLRVIVRDHQRPFNRFDTVARDRLSNLFAPLGGEYVGWQGHCFTNLPNPTHLIMVDEPSDEQIAKLLLFSRTSERDHGVSMKILREFKGRAGSEEYTISGLVRNIATLLGPLMLSAQDSGDVARGWSEIKIMEEMLIRSIATA